MILSNFFKWIESRLKPNTAITVALPNLNTTVTTAVAGPAEIADADLQTAIAIVNNVKAALSSPAAVLITDLIPGTVDDTIREELVSYLPQVTVALANIQGVIDTADKSALFNNILSKIKLSPNLDLDAFYHALAARVLTKVTKGGITWSLAVMSVEYFLKNIFKSTLAAPAAVATPVAEAPEQALPLTTSGTPIVNTITN